MDTHETYVSLEVAKLLKQAGFDWEIKDRWDYAPILKKKDAWDLRHWPEEPVNWNAKERETVYKYEPSISAPTLAVAQKWLREVKLIHIEITFGNKWIYTPYSLSDLSCLLPIEEFPTTRNYDTYEEALEAGIQKCLTFLLKDE